MKTIWKTRLGVGLAMSLLTVGFASPAYATETATTEPQTSISAPEYIPLGNGEVAPYGFQEDVVRVLNSFNECMQLGPIIAAAYGTPLWSCVPQPNGTTYLVLIKWW